MLHVMLLSQICEEAGDFSSEEHERALARIKEIAARQGVAIEYRELGGHFRGGVLRCTPETP